MYPTTVTAYTNPTSMSATNHFHSLILTFFMKGGNTSATFFRRLDSIRFSSRRVITVMMLDKLSNNVLETTCSFSFVSSKALMKGLSNLKIAQIVSIPSMTPIAPNKGEKIIMATKENENLDNAYMYINPF